MEIEGVAAARMERSVMQKYAYIRVSTKEQHVDRQLEAIKEQEIPKKNIYCDYQSGKDFERPAYRKLLRKLKRGDLLVIKSIDRLGRNYNEILEQWQILTKKMGVNIQVLDMPLLDTGTDRENLTGTLIADLVLQILAYVAQTERDFIRQRQAEGIAAARARGVRFGREEIPVSDEFEVCYQQWKEGSMSLEEGAKKTGVSRSTFYRRCKKKEEKCKNKCF